MLDQPHRFLVRKGSPAATEVIVYPDTFLSLVSACANITPAETAGALLGATQQSREPDKLRFVVHTLAPVGLVPSGLGLSLDREEWNRVCSLAQERSLAVIGWFYADSGIGIFPPRLDVVETQHELALAPSLFLLANPATDDGAFHLWQDGKFIPTGGFYEAVRDAGVGPLIPWTGGIPGGMEWLAQGVAESAGQAAGQVAQPESAEPVQRIWEVERPERLGQRAQLDYPLRGPESLEPAAPVAEKTTPVFAAQAEKVAPTRSEEVSAGETQKTLSPPISSTETPDLRARQGANQEEQASVEPPPAGVRQPDVAGTDTQISGSYHRRRPAPGMQSPGMYLEGATARDADRAAFSIVEQPATQARTTARKTATVSPDPSDLPRIRPGRQPRGVGWAAIAFLVLWVLLGLALFALLFTQGKAFLGKLGYTGPEQAAIAGPVSAAYPVLQHEATCILNHPDMRPLRSMNWDLYQPTTYCPEQTKEDPARDGQVLLNTMGCAHVHLTA